MKKVECQLCEGDGGTYYSCCGDELGPDPDSDFCPQCGEHCGEGDFEKCEHCNGLGSYFETSSMEEWKKEEEIEREKKAKHRQSVQHYASTGELYVGSSPPRGDNWPGRAYYNTIDGRIWQLKKSSWIPLPNQVDMTKLPKTYLVPGILMDNPTTTGRIKSGDFRLINPITPEEAFFKKEQEDEMMYGMPSSSTKVVHVDWKSIEKQTGLKFLNTDHNAPTNSNTNEQRKDYSIFDS